MGELLIQLTDVYYKQTQILKRIPFADRSNLFIMSNVLKPLVERKSTRVRKSQLRNCSCCISQDKAVEYSKSMQLKDLKIVIERCNWKDLGSAKKTNLQLGNRKLDSTVKSTTKKTNTFNKLLIETTSISPNIQKLQTNKKLYIMVTNNIPKCNSENSTIAIENDSNIRKGVNFNESYKQSKRSVEIISDLNDKQNNSIIKKVNIINKVTDEFENSALNTPIINKLRQRETKNYLETTEILPQANSILPKKRIPIYKNMKVKENINKKDPYELDLSDFEEKTMKKVKLRNASEKFDKTMYEVIQKLEKKHYKKPKKKTVLKNPPSYEHNIKSVLQRIMKKVDNKKHKTNNFNKLDTGQAQTVTYHTSQHFINIESHNKPIIPLQNLKDNSQSKISLSNISVPKIVNGIKDSNKILNNVDNEYCRSDSLIPTNVTKSDAAYSPSSFHELNREKEFFFGFDEDDSESNNRRINILSNITLNSVTYDNSITHDNIIGDSHKSPWRINMLKKSNYAIHYKKNAMPCLIQEEVVNFNITENIEKSKNKSKLQTPQKSHIQTSILDFVDFSQNNNFIYNRENMPENEFCPSLYDYEEFEICHPNNVTNKKRTVLGIIQANNLNKNIAVSTPLKDNIRTMPSLDISVIQPITNIDSNEESDSLQNIILVNKYSEQNNSYFGFNRNNSGMEVEKNNIKDSRPFRVSAGAIKNFKKQFRINKNTDKFMNNGEDLPSVLINNEHEENLSEDIRFFDDVEPELLVSAEIPIQYGSKGKRRQRLASVTSEYSDDDKPKKKKKNAMTKAEEEAYEKWAAQFNAMCSEIEKHNLEIE